MNFAPYRVTKHRTSSGTRIFVQRGAKSADFVVPDRCSRTLGSALEWVRSQVGEVANGQTFREWCKAREHAFHHEWRPPYKRRQQLWKQLTKIGLM